jgi:hypothetical protein
MPIKYINKIKCMAAKTNLTLGLFYFIYFLLFIYSHVHTLFGSFLPPAPRPHLWPPFPLTSRQNLSLSQLAKTLSFLLLPICTLQWNWRKAQLIFISGCSTREGLARVVSFPKNERDKELRIYTNK